MAASWSSKAKARSSLLWIHRCSCIYACNELLNQALYIRFESGSTRDGLTSDQVSTDRPKRFPKRGQTASAALGVGYGCGDSYDLPFELTRANDPIDAVLENARKTMPVFGGRDEKRIAVSDGLPPDSDDFGFSIGFQIR